LNGQSQDEALYFQIEVPIDIKKPHPEISSSNSHASDHLHHLFCFSRDSDGLWLCGMAFALRAYLHSIFHSPFARTLVVRLCCAKDVHGRDTGICIDRGRLLAAVFISSPDMAVYCKERLRTRFL